MPIDINNLRGADRGGNPDLWRDMTQKRFKDPKLVDNVIALDEQWRKAQFDMEQAKKNVGVVQKEISAKMKAKESAEAEKAKKTELETEVTKLEALADELLKARDKALDLIPNELDPTVPVSNNEDDNDIVRTHGECRPQTADLLHHHELLAMIDGYEAERGVAVAGHRAYFLKGNGLMLNQALVNYGLSFLSGREYVPIQPPYFMNKDVMAGVAQLSDFDEQLYKVIGEDEKYLIATSEQPICALHKGEWLTEKEMPKRYAGYSACFRKEAGSHGRDTWGIFRVHQFEKIEQFIMCAPEESARHHDEMIGAAEAFYQSLGLAYRVVNIVSGELNNAAAKKFDLEAWFPTLACYRELVSASNCTDYQSRAMEVRCGHPGATKGAQGPKRYVHFLNSTLCATTRTLCCLLENYQTPEGIRVPEPLIPFMGGKTFIPFTKEKPRHEVGIAKKAAAAPATTGAGATAAATPKAAAAAPVAEKKAAAPAPAPAAAPRVAVATGSTAATLSAEVLGLIGRPVLKSAAGLTALNNALAVRSYVADYNPSAEDAAVFTGLVAAGLTEGSAGLASYPNIQRWARHMASFAAEQRTAWPLTQAQLVSGAVDARKSTLFTL